MKRSEKLNKIHSLLILIFSIACITGAVFFCYDKSVTAYICWCVCILMFPCMSVLNFEYRSSLWAISVPCVLLCMLFGWLEAVFEKFSKSILS